MILGCVEVSLNRSSRFTIGKGDDVDSCKIRVYNSELGSQHPIDVQAYGILRNCVIYSEIDEPILIHARARVIGNAIFPMEKTEKIKHSP